MFGDIEARYWIDTKRSMYSEMTEDKNPNGAIIREVAKIESEQLLRRLWKIHVRSKKLNGFYAILETEKTVAAKKIEFQLLGSI